MSVTHFTRHSVPTASAADASASDDRPIRHLPFGKHKGRLLREAPTPYLTWLSQQEWVMASLKRALTAELNRRHATALHADLNRHQRSTPPARLLDQAPSIDRDLARAIIAVGEREVLRRQIDPGDDEREAVLRTTVEWLRHQLDRLPR